MKLNTLAMIAVLFLTLGMANSASAGSYHGYHGGSGWYGGGKCGPTSECKKYDDYDKEEIYKWFKGPDAYSWDHDGLGSVDSLTSASLKIKAYDIDNASEINSVHAYDTNLADWVDLGNLTPGGNNNYSWTTFSLGEEWFDEIAAGLQLKVLFEKDHWVSKLKWSKLSVHGEYCPPVSEVPLPAAVWLFGSALVGFTSFRRRLKKA